AENMAFAMPNEVMERQIQEPKAGFRDFSRGSSDFRRFRPFSCRFAGFRTGVIAARCPGARKNGRGGPRNRALAAPAGV
ncbi:MAG: hypothetical protein OXD29_12670, partial [Roseovarius sp.]|nr:hypothetical protein [Roseovarius sp.]